ncbi:hypothetical protein JR316_0012905 [Psilocybe cubensis]|uniref:Uncharacterized protein n=2 Tax=Psilocybe cubensis TaxID=181762 RepID=A0A8H8CHC8_PSICU|nr:hypothetical protein JR316_0012905 [Psilocybe cubensis]KAH9474446.1 hypothetical protein JR316_0012905 [Psilocybe cubensis]
MQSTGDEQLSAQTTTSESDTERVKNEVPGSHKLNYVLPSTVASVRDGWQWTCQSGAVVSGLLAAIAAQLLTLFSTPPPNQASPTPQAVQDFLLITCYIAIFFNINATICSFTLIDKLGEIGFKTSANIPSCDPEKQGGQITCTQEGLLQKYNAGRTWRPMLWFWLFNFFVGVLSLIVSIMTFVCIQGSIAMKTTLGLSVFIDTLVLFYFIVSNGFAD